MSDSPDPVLAWAETRDRVAALLAPLDAAATDVHVPACPAWTVRDLLAHMVGLGADVLAGEEADDHNEDWTQAHVDARADRDVAALLAEWRTLGDDLQAHMRAHGPRPLADAVIHEQDLRGAVGAPGDGGTDGFRIVRGWMADRVGGQVGDLPVLALRAPDWSWHSGEGEPAVVVEASGFDLGRALCSRRTADQLRGWTTRGDVGPYLDAFAHLGGLPDEPLPA